MRKIKVTAGDLKRRFVRKLAKFPNRDVLIGKVGDEIDWLVTRHTGLMESPVSELVEHVLDAHLEDDPTIVLAYGVCAFDYELLALIKDLGEEVDVSRIVSRLTTLYEEEDVEILRRIDAIRKDKHLTPTEILVDFATATVDEYKNWLLMNLSYLEQLGLAIIDWDRLGRKVEFREEEFLRDFGHPYYNT